MSSSSEELDDISFVDYVESLRIPYEEIELATNNFADTNLLPIHSPSSSSFPKLNYKGQLKQSDGQLIDIVARKIPEEQDNIVFNELLTSYLLTHKNILPIFKISGTDDPIIINKYEANGSLDKHLSHDSNLTWMQRLHICVGVAHALSYIHDYDAEGDFSVIHGNVKSSKILLDENWEPKLNCFGFSMFVRKHQPHLASKYSGTLQYTDPEYVDTGCLTPEYDIFSFGVVLFEVLFGEIASVKDGNNWYFARSARSRYEKKTLDDMINIDLHKQMDPQSLEIFSKTAYGCLEEKSSKRPNMVEIVEKLEASLELQQNHESLMNFEINTDDTPMKVNIIVDHAPTAPKTEVTSLPSNDFAHLKIPIEDVLSATNNFDEENLTEEAEFGNAYIGQLLWSGELIDIDARRFNKQRDEGEQEFWMEISMLSSLKHKNLVSLVGFCDENDEKIIIIKLERRGSLDNYLSDPMLLTWVRRLEICVGLANASSYIHYDEAREFSVIHRNIDSLNVLLNDNWKPKLSEFRLSLKINAYQRHDSFCVDKVWGREGYTDPTYIETKSVSHKSDIYSFGIVMFELLCGRKAVIDDDQDNKYLGSVAVAHYREKKLNEKIDRELWNQMDSQSFNIFAEIAYDCLNEERSQRPNIDEIVTRLERALELQLEHQNAIMNEFAHLRVPLQNILSATNNFAQQNLIGESSGFDKIYMGQLLWSGELIEIDARRLDKEWDGVEQHFWTEISLLSTLKHKNLVSIVGFCDENDEKIIIIKREIRGCLDYYLSDPFLLTWVRRLEISIGVAHALSYIHNYDAEGDFSVIHGNVKSSKILLDENWEPKLNCFGFSMFVKKHQPHLTSKYSGTLQYTDPAVNPRCLTHESDVYSFGVVLFEVLFGRIASVKDGDNWYFARSARLSYERKILGDMIDPDLLKQMNLQSLEIFSETAYSCLEEESSRRPNMAQIVEKLDASLELQQNHESLMDFESNTDDAPMKVNIIVDHAPTAMETEIMNEFAHLRVPLQNILSATNNFAEENVTREDSFDKRYKGQLLWSGELIKIQARRFNKEWDGVEQLFWMEISMLSSLKHKNLVSLVGFCDDNDEKIIITRRETRGSLGNYLSDPMLLTWVRRLEISVGVAHALSYIHYDEPRDFSVIHRLISSDRVLLNEDWEPKLSGFECSMKMKASQRHNSFHTSKVWYEHGYGDPTYVETKSTSHKSDIYSFGIVLFQLLCGRKAVSDDQDNKYLGPLVFFHYEKKILDEIIDPVLKKQMDPQSFNVFAKTAYECLNEERSQRPDISEVVTTLENALKRQMERQNVEVYEKRELKLPKDYKEIIKMSKCPEIYSTIKKEELYNIFSKGILLQQDKVLLSFDGNGERNKMVSAAMFSYVNSCPHAWKSLQESRFETVVEMFDISQLNIEIKTNTHLLSPNFVYGVYLVFKFSDSIQFSSKPMYVNLKYRSGLESLHAYFATWRDKDWMMIELYRFQKGDMVFDFLLESFSSYYYGDAAVYVEGIEFRAIGEVKHEEIGNLMEVQQVLKSNFNVDQVQQLPTEEIFKIYSNYDELFWLGEIDGKKLLALSAKAALYKFSNVDTFTSKPPAQSRFQEVIELLPQAVFRINCTIKSQMLSPDTEYVCYLLFKLSENCQGMHCPVKVRDVLHQENKEAEFLYFITPETWNVHDVTQVPKQREDGWMEIQVWKFISAHEFKDDSLSMNMRFTSLEGTMSGLIVCGLEFRPM